MNQYVSKIIDIIIKAIYPFLVLYLAIFTLIILLALISGAKIYLDVFLVLYGIPLVLFILIKLFKRTPKGYR